MATRSKVALLVYLWAIMSGCGEKPPESTIEQQPISQVQPNEKPGQEAEPVNDIDPETLAAIMADVPEGWTAVKVRVLDASGKPIPKLKVGFHKKGDFNVFKGGDTNGSGEIATAAPVGNEAELIIVKLEGDNRQELHKSIVNVPAAGSTFEIVIK